MAALEHSGDNLRSAWHFHGRRLAPALTACRKALTRFTPSREPEHGWSVAGTGSA